MRLVYLGVDGQLSLYCGRELVDAAPLAHGWQTLGLWLPDDDAPLRLEVAPVVLVDGDARELGVRLSELTLLRSDVEAAATLAELGLLVNCHPAEQAAGETFVWTRPMFRFRSPSESKFARLRFAYLGPNGRLRLTCRGATVDEVAIQRGWQEATLRLPLDVDRGRQRTADGEWLTISVEPTVQVAADARELGIMLRGLSFFRDPGLFRRLRGRAENALLNEDEFRRGLPIVASHPPMLRVNLEARCNIPESSQACAYCAWDWAKESERGSPAFRLDTLAELGDFYQHAQLMGDCSIGEPTMHKQFGEIVAQIDRDGKQFSFTTNGQLLVARRRRELLGMHAAVYVSIDSATAAGYARYRNDRFDDIIANLRALCREKPAHDNLPTVFASFIVMRSNYHELPEYFRLMKDVGVDQIKLRTLYLDDNVDPIVSNNGYRFDYAAEVLSMSELAPLGDLARRLAAEHEIAAYVEWDEFEATATHMRTEPICAEPWRTLYVLRRGIMPCCYATEPIAHWSQQGDRPLAAFLQDTFNSTEYQHLRSELAAGRLSVYCQNQRSCPVLKRAAAERQDPALPAPACQPSGAFGRPPKPHFALPLSPAECASGSGCMNCACASAARPA